MASSQQAAPVTPYLASGSRVVLVVSKGEPERPPGGYVTMPDVTGRDQGDALSSLQAQGIEAHVFNDYSTEQPRGRVMGQLPAAGAGAAAGSEVTLMVSSGPFPNKSVATVPLPDVVGRPEAEAVATLEQAGFSPHIVRESSPSVPAGKVIAQLPNRDSLATTPKKSSAWIWVVIALLALALGVIAYFLFAGGKQVPVPDLTGKAQADAVKTLQDAGLKLGSVEPTESSDYDEGAVASQTPAPGTEVREGSAVDLIVVGGPELIEVPDVMKKSEAEATSQLEEAGFVVSKTEAPSSDVDKGFVVSQTPGAGQKVPKGTTIGIVVSQGKPVENVKIPDVVGLTREDAETTIKDAGLKAAIVENPSETVAQGVVISQVPGADEEVAKGTTMGVVVSSGPPASDQTEQVPDLTGKTLAEAQAALNAASLGALPVPIDGTGKPANQIVAQSPEAGVEVAPGSTVVVFYASGK